MREPVIVVDYSPQWPDLFEQEREILATIFEDTGSRIEHVGSTAVPNLGAKPIIDMMIGVPDLKIAEERIPELAAQGYGYVPAYEKELPQRRYFRKPSQVPRSHHLHCVLLEGEYWRNHLAFRDHLRQHEEAPREYFELKKRLSGKHGRNRTAYLEGKSDFIASILAKATGKTAHGETM